MSERGSFCTEYIYCPQCFDALRDAFFAAFSDVAQVGSAPIIAGCVRGMYAGEEYDIVKDVLQDTPLCHIVRVVVFCGDGYTHFLSEGETVKEVDTRLTLEEIGMRWEMEQRQKNMAIIGALAKEQRTLRDIPPEEPQEGEFFHEQF